MFERKELHELINKARNLAKIEGTNPVWQRAYLRLIDAADHLDAMIARSTVVTQTTTSTDEQVEIKE